MSASKLISLAEAVRRYTHDGMQYASGAALPVGADCVAFGRELLRAGRARLDLVSHCTTQQTNLLCAAGAVARMECGFTGLEVFGFANGLRRAAESGALAIEDYSNLAMSLRLLAGALNLPFMPTHVGIGCDIQWRSTAEPERYPARNKIPEIADPFTGRTLGALSPLRPDLAAIHVTLADVEGNAIMIGSEWSRFELSRAARQVVLVADHIVDTACMRQYPNLVRIPGVVVDAVVWWPFSAWPQASPGVHDCDEVHMREMNSAFATAEGTAAYLDRYVRGYRDLPGYLDLIGRARIGQLSDTATAFLLDPFRRWIVPEGDLAAVVAHA